MILSPNTQKYANDYRIKPVRSEMLEQADRGINSIFVLGPGVEAPMAPKLHRSSRLPLSENAIDASRARAENTGSFHAE
jgi:hypothetical protein